MRAEEIERLARLAYTQFIEETATLRLRWEELPPSVQDGWKNVVTLIEGSIKEDTECTP